MKRFTMPWPYACLWPNARCHWTAKAKAAKAYRFEAKCLARGAEVGLVRIIFCPKSKGPVPDRDNRISACKALQDGLADALGVNDRDIIVTYTLGERCKDGAVIVEIGEMLP